VQQAIATGLARGLFSQAEVEDLYLNGSR
jgi:hypothetical protein